MNFIGGTLTGTNTRLAHVALDDGSAVTVAADTASIPAGARVTVGLRPEHVEASSEVHEAREGTMRAHVQLAEHLGDTTYLHVTLTGLDPSTRSEAMTVRTAPDNPLKTGDTAYLSFPPQRGFLFDDQGRTLPGAD
jgi:multiple sugar transport system ATP-binding protein